jgi:predicted DCC family thiol-disulfide oxidoreductase YuxK
MSLFCKTLIQWDREKKLYFCPLQKKEARDFLNDYPFKNPYLSTLIYWDQTQVYEKSEAFLEALTAIKHYNFFVRFFRLFPIRLRDFIYEFIAKNRLILFAKPTCEIPKSEDLKRFL